MFPIVCLGSEVIGWPFTCERTLERIDVEPSTLPPAFFRGQAVAHPFRLATELGQGSTSADDASERL
jgi:hypothetical protein